MTTYWPWLLIVLACPLMMMFMMRGMGRTDRGGVPPDSGSMPTVNAEQARITQLEHEVAELREQRDRDEDILTRREMPGTGCLQRLGLVEKHPYEEMSSHEDLVNCL